MVKKYHQTRKDRRDESRGMKKYWEDRGQERPMDSRYFGMISEDHRAPANLPQEVVHKMYPKCDYMDSHELDDTIRGLDDTRDDVIREIDRHQSQDKY